MDFGQVLNMIKGRYKLARKGWNGKGMFIEGQFPDVHSKMTKPYIFIKTANNDKLPWIPSQEDLFAIDWEVIK